MPGRYPGQVVAVHSEQLHRDRHRKGGCPRRFSEMMASGMRTLTGDKDARDSWARFFTPSDVVGIKVNCSGAPGIMSTPEVVAEIVRNLTALGVKPAQIWIYERFPDQVAERPLRPLRARGRAHRGHRDDAPLDRRLRSQDVRRGGFLRRRRHALEPGPAGHRAASPRSSTCRT